MMKIGVADYGMFVWEGGLFDYEQRARDLKAIGYDGMERLRPATEADALNMASRLNALGCDFATVEAPTAELSIRWAAAFRKDYVWIKVTGKTFDDYCRQVNVQAEACERWGLKVALHNHLGSLVEKQDELDEFMRRCLGAAAHELIQLVLLFHQRAEMIMQRDLEAPALARLGLHVDLTAIVVEGLPRHLDPRIVLAECRRPADAPARPWAPPPWRKSQPSAFRREAILSASASVAGRRRSMPS